MRHVLSRTLLLSCACVLAPCIVAPSLADAASDFIDRWALTRGFRSGQPTAIAIPHDVSEVLFLRSGPRDRVQSLWAWDARTGAERELLTGARLLGGATESLSSEERAKRERLRQTAAGLSSFQLSKDGRRVLVPYSGRVFLLSRPGHEVRELGAPGGAAADEARLSPDGGSV